MKETGRGFINYVLSPFSIIALILFTSSFFIANTTVKCCRIGYCKAILFPSVFLCEPFALLRSGVNGNVLMGRLF